MASTSPLATHSPDDNRMHTSVGGVVGGTVPPTFLRPGDPRWVEQSFSKRDCCRFVTSTKETSQCACGQTWAYHKTHGVESVGEPGEVWAPTFHTVSSPTDAYGTIDFLGGPHPNKAQFIRLGFDSRPDLILQLLTREWGLELPKLIISVHGGKANFELNPRLKRVLRKGLLRAAKTTGAWILTGGTSTGVTRHVGDALISERSPRLRGGRVVSIGIAPWGVVENRVSLIGRKKDVAYQSIDHPRSKFAALNNRHAYFLLADNGTVGRYGAEIALRRKLEKYISSQRLLARTNCSIPVVCLVVEGGMHTIRTVLEYVTDSPPVPVVVVEGSGRAADLIAFAHKYASETGESSTVLDGMREQLLAAIQRTFHIHQSQADKLLAELLQCVKKKNLITIFRPSDSAATADITGDGHELDHAILSALFRARHLSAAEQLCLALAWNRVDIARSEIFVYGQEWTEGALEEAMMEALVKNRVDFVKLLLETGVQMARFLTIARLEELYNSKQGPANTLRYIVRDVRPYMPRNYSYTLIDIGLVINKLMGGAYRSSYTRRKFRHNYTILMKKPTPVVQSALARVYSNHVLRNGGNNQSTLDDSQCHVETSFNLFSQQPFNELLIWSVLTKRQAMAKLMWHHGEEALAKALVASKLYRAMASEAADDDLEVEIYDELRSYAAEFDREALELLDYCYRQDDDLAQQLLTCELSNWSRQTCLRLAFACHHRELLAHPCAQLILGDLWLGGLRTRRSTNLKIVLAIICPPLILRLEFKSKEELQLMPQTEEEHMIDLKDEGRDNNTSSDHSSSNSSSASSSPSSSPRSERSASMRRVSVADGVEMNAGGGSSHHRQRHHSGSSTPGATSSVPIVEKDELNQENNTSKEQIVFEAIDPGVIYERRRMRQLRIKRKFYEFYAAPITKFWSWSMAYFIFLIIYTYTVLIRTPPTPEWNECYVILHMASFGGEKVREILASEPVKLSHKISVWASSVWNCCDAFFVIEFFIAMIFRLQKDTLEIGHVLYCLNIVFWYIRILRILQVSKFLGPFVTMIGRMLEKMIYYITLMLVVLMSYGVFRQSVLFPHEEFSWFLVRDIFFKPYFMIYGELFAGDIDPPCGNGTKPDGSFDPDMPPCETGRWLNPLLMTCYLLVANILLLNLLIAVFNSIFLRTNVFSHQIWKFNRFNVVMEYEQKPALPPPLIIFSHLYLIFKWCRRCSKGMKESYDYGLKLFLDKDDLERLYDFEEESMEGLVREREAKQHQSTDERVRLIGERLDGMGSKIEDSYQKSAQHSDSLQSLDFRLMRLEEVLEQTNASLAVIHRFMSFQKSIRSSDGDRQQISPTKNRRSFKSSPNVAVPATTSQPLTVEDFRRHLTTVDPSIERSRMGGRKSSCAAFDPEDDGQISVITNPPPIQIHQVVEPQDLAMLRSLGNTGGSHLRRRTVSETSKDGVNILQSMEFDAAAREGSTLYEPPLGRHLILGRTSSSPWPDVPPSPKRVGRIKEEDDELGTTTLAIASYDSSERSISQMLSTPVDDGDEELTEVFEQHDNELLDDTMVDTSSNVLLLGPSASSSPPQYHRSYSVGAGVVNQSGGAAGVGGETPGMKRSRNWSGTEVGFSPRGSRRQKHRSPQPIEDEKKMCSDQTIQPVRRTRLQSMHSYSPPGTAMTAMVDQQPPPKINIIPAGQGIPRSKSNGAAPSRLSTNKHPPAAAKVEAEAEHLREIEGQDYHMMEGIIRRRLHRDSEDLDNSLEDLCNVPIPLEEALDSFDESPEIEREAINFIVGDSQVGPSGQEDKQQQAKQPILKVKSSSEPPPDGHKSKASSRPVVKIGTSNVSTDDQEGISLTRSVNLLSMPCSQLRPEEDVTIIVEDEC
ncbi:hypothetical protein GHT06_019895 [Daphnia sinensis]|uniref:Transient receptor potential cation channel trpm n=1 Tax=Daphnia sinensis TaxID=1820382 RepID=A0AAD5KKQ9_9CRUS|nr:hypothetical protein GHT06_019895 [Daphnia sinensis]